MSISQFKTMMVTGGGGGIGLEVARICAAMGMNTVLADIHGERLQGAVAAFEGPVLGIEMDVSNKDDWARAKREAEARFGGVDLLVNSAAIPPCLVPILDMDAASFEARIAVNLSSVFYAARTFGPAMRDRGYGHIVNISSSAGLTGMLGLGDYGPAKYGVIGFTEVLRLELEGTGVRASVAVPGLTRSNMTVGQGMMPNFVAQAIVDGVTSDAFYIITHPDCKPGIEKRFQEILAAIGEPAQPDYVNNDPRWV